MQEYADPVIDWLDAGRGILPHRFFRDVRYFPPEFALYCMFTS
jgi:TFIIF-interacting CTD phosphatase-like protein